jgi:two-component system NtrC family response regulator
LSSENDHEAPRKVLVVDDDEQIRKQIQWALAGDYDVYAANDRPQAIDVCREQSIPVILLDLGLPPHPREASEGLAALEQILATDPLAKVIIVSGNSDRQNAVAAIARGAHDVFPKPIDLDQLRVVLARAHSRLELEVESRQQTDTEPSEGFGTILANSPRMREVFRTVSKVACKDIPVLITGESGTGKECIANSVHALSPRRDGPFVAINCGAIPETLLESELFGHEKGAFTGADVKRVGKLECADKGTLFLDEVGEMSTSSQVKLLRFLQERTLERVGGRESISVDTRVVAATNIDLEQAVSDGRFREDLYFRIAVVPIALPPLRERGQDALLLANHFVSLYSQELEMPAKKLSKGAANAIQAFSWPGNVRELQNRVKRAVVLAEGPTIGAAELELDSAKSPVSTRVSASLKKAKQALEREMVGEALAANNGNISRSARELGISRPTLYDLISKYAL